MPILHLPKPAGMKFLSFLGPLNFIKISTRVVSDKIAAEKNKFEEEISKTVILFISRYNAMKIFA